MRPRFPVYTECTFKCETPEKSAEPKDCAKSCEIVRKQSEKIEKYTEALLVIEGLAYMSIETGQSVKWRCHNIASEALKEGAL